MKLFLIAIVALIATGLVSHSACTNTPTSPEEKPCGYLPPNQPNRQLIAGGDLAREGQWPWMAFIFKRDIVVSGNDKTWRNFTTAKGQGCDGSCVKNESSGLYGCPLKPGSGKSWDYCCAPDNNCGRNETDEDDWCWIDDEAKNWTNCKPWSLPAFSRCNKEWKGGNGEWTLVEGEIIFKEKGCEDFKKERLCKNEGDHYGEGWEPWMGTFDNWKDLYGMTPLVCPQCGCKEDMPVWEPLCGGAIIESQWILTAAHCLWLDPWIKPGNSSSYCVVVGGTHNVRPEPWASCTPEQRPLKVIRHPTFDETQLAIQRSGEKITLLEAKREIDRQNEYHDIALLKMPPISFATPAVGRICLPTEDMGNYYDKSCHTAGWGRTDTGIHDRKSLKTLKSQIWSESVCRTKSNYGILGNHTDNFYCFGDANGTICHGDSGSPLMCKNSNGQFEAVGVVHGGTNHYCEKWKQKDGETGYFVRVPTFLSWIKETIEANTDSKSNDLGTE